MNKFEIIEFLQKNPSWVLQYRHGVLGNGWWWLRNMDDMADIKQLYRRSAKAATKMLNIRGPYRSGETNYGL